MFEKLVEIKTYLTGKFMERENVIDAMLVALLARQHVLLIGPPGTAKSALVVELAKIIQGANYFQWLLTRFTTPEELFGPVSLKELEKGIYKRNTAGKLPEAHLAFIDELFKANSAILNSLLTLINERVFYNNGHPVQTPLMTIVGASNEYPEEGEGLEALYDRFLLRFEVDYVKEKDSFVNMLKSVGNEKTPPSLTLEELQNMQFFVEMVSIPDEVYEALFEIRQKLMDEGIRPSDRRFKQSLGLLQAKAMLEQRQEVRVEDILLLINALWETPEQKQEVAEVVKEFAQDKVTAALERIAAEAQEILNGITNSTSTDEAVESAEKMKMLERELEQLSAKYPGRREEIESLQLRLKQNRDKIVHTIVGAIGL